MVASMELAIHLPYNYLSSLTLKSPMPRLKRRPVHSMLPQKELEGLFCVTICRVVLPRVNNRRKSI